ncbi:MAG: competence/damage-inducible protein A [Bacteroidota bacterium]
MNAEIISIGDELLIGQTINTNASWIGSELALINIKVKNCQTISDQRKAIMDAFDLAFERSDLIIVTGGLGPTKDDITKHVLCEYFNTELEVNQEVLKRIEDYFYRRDRKMLEVNALQASLPKACEMIPNLQGTASGMWFEKAGKVLISLPGVPYEMKGMMKAVLLDKIGKFFHVKALFHRTILTTGIGESFLAEKAKDWENDMLSKGFSLAYLPSPGLVKLRITSPNGEKDKALIDSYFKELKEIIPENVFGYENDTLAGVIGEKLKKSKKTLSSVESCTGGGIANEIVSISGASEYYQGSIVAYSYDLKCDLVDVKMETLTKFGAVSEETAKEMALGGLNKMKTDFCIATTGIAGPDGGTAEKPVGTVWISIASKEKIVAKCYNFGDNRERNMKMTIFAALNLLRNSFLDEK